MAQRTHSWLEVRTLDLEQRAARHTVALRVWHILSHAVEGFINNNDLLRASALTFTVALSIVPIPDEKQLAAYTATVYRNCPYSDKQLTAAPYPEKTAIPTRVGDPSPIKHVIYIIKENRTYDQVLGDVPAGNGDASLAIFGGKVTPNHHALASQFGLFDNFYAGCPAEVIFDTNRFWCGWMPAVAFLASCR